MMARMRLWVREPPTKSTSEGVPRAEHLDSNRVLDGHADRGARDRRLRFEDNQA
jgi:hypothetical protein